MKLWKINCMEYRYPGMWQRWYRHQCVAVGWYHGWGYNLVGKTEGGHGWSMARNLLQEIAIGDYVVVALRHHKVGRLGKVTDKAVSDTDWEPMVPRSVDLPDGEMGRRILVRWELTIGPNDQDLIIALPQRAQFTVGELRPTISEIRSQSLEKLQTVMNDPDNWVGLVSHFDYERALSGYIAAYPHRLEDGLLPHPNERVRERVFKDKSRLDILLTDRDGLPVVVECKQGAPTLGDLEQLRHYLKQLSKETDQVARGILVHGGAHKLHREIRQAALDKPRIEIVQYRLDLDFSRSN